jgi:hypothetical protein
MQDRTSNHPAGLVRRALDYAKSEPVAVQGVIQAGIALLLGFGLVSWTTEQAGLTLALSAAILGLVARRQVTPNAKAGGEHHSPAPPAQPAPADANSKSHA